MIIIIIFKINSIYKIDEDNNTEKEEENNNNNINQEEFNESTMRKNIIYAIYNKLDIYSYFDKSNLKSFEIIDLLTFGYYESQDNILYIQVTYNFECNDGTSNCNKLSKYKYETPYFFIKIDINTYDDIEYLGYGISSNINSDWVQKYEYIK